MLLGIFRQRRRILTGTLGAVLMLVLGVETALPDFFDRAPLVWAGTLCIMACIFACVISVFILLLPRLRHMVEVGALAGLLDVSARRFLPELFASFDNFILGDLFIVVAFLALMMLFYGERSSDKNGNFSYRGRSRLRTAGPADHLTSVIRDLGWEEEVALRDGKITDTRQGLSLPDAMRSWFDDAAGQRADTLRTHLARFKCGAAPSLG